MHGHSQAAAAAVTRGGLKQRAAASDDAAPTTAVSLLVFCWYSEQVVAAMQWSMLCLSLPESQHHPMTQSGVHNAQAMPSNVTSGCDCCDE